MRCLGFLKSVGSDTDYAETYEPPEENGQRKNVGLGAALCSQSAPHKRIQPTKEAALKHACAQLLQGHAVNRIVGPNETITADRIRDWCAKHRPIPRHAAHPRPPTPRRYIRDPTERAR